MVNIPLNLAPFCKSEAGEGLKSIQFASNGACLVHIANGWAPILLLKRARVAALALVSLVPWEEFP